MSEIEQLQQTIATLEAQRPILGDAVVETAIGPLREKLAALQSKQTKQSQEGQQRKLITVLFADVSGFTHMSEQLDHEEVSEVINALWSRLDKTILEHGGFIDKHIGDAVMALFGAPTAQEDDAERAIRAALGMQTEIKKWKEYSEANPALHSLVQHIQMRIGINTGPVLLGTIGSTGEYTAIGDAVNLASRVEHAAPVGGVLISQDTYRHVRGIFEVTPLDPIQVKGKSEPVQVYVVNARRPRSFRITTRGVEGIETRTIGREVEMEKMKAALRAVMETGRARMVSIVAEAGTGKSRLLYEFLKWLEEHHYPVSLFKGRATPEMKHTPYALVRNLLATSFEIQDSDPASTAREKLERGLLANANSDREDTYTWPPLIGHLIGYDYTDDPRLQGLLADARQIRDLAFHYLTQFFANSLQDQAGVILLEDIHWSDNGSLDLIEHITNNRPDLPLLIIGLTRPVLFEERPGWGSGPFEHLRLDLQPLSAQDSRHLVADILRKVAEVPPALVELIVKRAEGSPFYVEELIKALIDEGIIVRDEEQWRVREDRLPDLKVPATLTGVLQARLDNLPVADREVLQQASVVGRVFWNKVVEHMRNPESHSPDSPLLVADRLEKLEKKELIFHREASAFAETPEYIFKHAILHDVTYESVLRRLRKVYHVQVAENLIELGGERVNEYAGRVGEHFELAEEWSRAAEWYTRAGIQAQEAYAPEAAANYFQKALHFLKDQNGAEQVAGKQEVYRRLGEVLNWQARYSEAAEMYQMMLELARDQGNAESQSRAHFGLATSLGYQGNQRGALENAIQAEKLARQADSHIDLLKAVWIQGTSRFRLGESQAVLELGEQALAIATRLGNQDEIGRSLHLIGAAHYVNGRYRQAEEHFERALAIFRERGNRHLGMDMLSNLGVIAEARGDYELALERYHNALEIARQIGYRDGEIVFLSNRGGQHVALKDYQAAENDLVEAIRLAGVAGSWILAVTYANLALAYSGQNKTDEALFAAKNALELVQSEDSPEYTGIAWRALGMIAAHLGAPVTVRGDATSQVANFDAETCFERSANAFAEAGLEGERARTLREWAKYKLDHGDTEHGQAMWRQAREIFASLEALREVERMDSG